MNILIDRLPECVIANGRRFSIETDYRAAVAFELLVDGGETDIYKLIAPFYPQGLPADIEGAVTAVLWHYGCGEEKPEGEGKSDKAKPYSFDFDADVIFSDFWRHYNIDLSSEALHWWAFRALLAGLPEESGYKQRIYYRTCNLKGLPKAEQERIKRIRNIIAINKKTGNKKLSLDERNALMLEYVAKRSAEAEKGG